jgi:hypothetical protein
VSNDLYAELEKPSTYSHTWLGLNPQIGRPLSGIVVPLVYFFHFFQVIIMDSDQKMIQVYNMEYPSFVFFTTHASTFQTYAVLSSNNQSSGIFYVLYWMCTKLIPHYKLSSRKPVNKIKFKNLYSLQ